MSRRKRRPRYVPAWVAAVLLAVALGAPGSYGQSAAAEITLQQVEAAYLYKFGGYVTWPDKAFSKADSPVVIGVAGADRVAAALASLTAGRTIGDRPVTVRRIHAEDELGGVHILFIGDPRAPDSGRLFESARGQPMLVVTEGEDGLQLGGAVSFVVIEDHLRFDVSLGAAQRSGLKLSALLLSVAHRVDEAKP